VKVAVDTSVLLDVLAGDPAFGPASREALRAAYDSGSLIVCEVVWSEVRANFPAEEAFRASMDALGVRFSALTAEAASLAGSLWREHHARRPRGGGGGAAAAAKRVVADFLVGAHAQLQADALLARDRGFFRSYFKELRLLQPSY
jgi:predicted nucleic acid-binding protein